MSTISAVLFLVGLGIVLRVVYLGVRGPVHTTAQPSPPTLSEFVQTLLMAEEFGIAEDFYQSLAVPNKEDMLIIRRVGVQLVVFVRLQGILKVDQVQAIISPLGLRFAGLWTLIQLNEQHPEFAHEHPHLTFYSEVGDSWFAAFHQEDGKVTRVMGLNDSKEWHGSYWWFATEPVDVLPPKI